MTLGKLTRALLISPIVLAFFLIPALIAGSVFGLRISLWSLLVYGLLFVLVLWCFKWLAKRWPAIFGAVAVEGGPRLTISRVFILCGSIGFCVASIVFLSLAIQLTGVQTALVGGVVFGFLLVVVTLLERRWNASDEAGRITVG